MNNNINMADITGQPKLEEKGKIGKIFILVVILVAIIIFAEGSGLVYFANKSQRLSKQIEKQKAEGLKVSKPGYEKLRKEMNELKEKYAALEKKYKAAEEDRGNLVRRVKALAAGESRVKELEETLKKMQVERDSIDKEVNRLRDDNFALMGEVKQLKKTEELLAEERDGLKSLYEKAKSKTPIKMLKKQLAASRNENKKLDAGIKRAQGNLKNLQKSLEKTQRSVIKLTEQNIGLAAEIKQLKKQLAIETREHNKKYAEAVKRNKALEREIQNIPKKFSEISRQNKKLIKETAKMHYNLGVFYTQNKEYTRAVAEFKKAAEINPNDAYTHFNLGYIYAEHMLNRRKAIEEFRHFLRLAKADDKDTDWVRKYLLTWETYEGARPLK